MLLPEDAGLSWGPWRLTEDCMQAATGSLQGENGTDTNAYARVMPWSQARAQTAAPRAH